MQLPVRQLIKALSPNTFFGGISNPLILFLPNLEKPSSAIAP